jgi:hypothetical protein
MAWGIPLSPLTFVGNLCCTPFIFLFLGGSVVWSILYIAAPWLLPPCTLFLNYLTQVWLAALRWGSDAPLVGIPMPHPLIACLIPLSACTLLYLPLERRIGRYTELACWVGGVVGWILFLKLACASTTLCTMPVGKTTLTCIPRADGISLHDAQGTLRAPKNIDSWLTFTLKPFVVKQFGALSCKGLRLTKVTAYRAQVGYELFKRQYITQLEVPWKFKKSKWWQEWAEAHHDMPIVYFYSDR